MTLRPEKSFAWQYLPRNQREFANSPGEVMNWFSATGLLPWMLNAPKAALGYRAEAALPVNLLGAIQSALNKQAA